MIISAGTACISQKKRKEQSVGAGFVFGSFEELHYFKRTTIIRQGRL